jgi:HK97 gp10 family phage protein
VNIRASSNFKPGNLAAFEAKLVPRLISAVGKGTGIVADEARAICPVDTGELQASIGATVAWVGQQVTGAVAATAKHAAYVEFGTGVRGSAAAGAGPYPYSPAWPGMPAKPYLRPAIDTSHAAILDAFREEGFR